MLKTSSFLICFYCYVIVQQLPSPTCAVAMSLYQIMKQVLHIYYNTHALDIHVLTIARSAVMEVLLWEHRHRSAGAEKPAKRCHGKDISECRMGRPWSWCWTSCLPASTVFALSPQIWNRSDTELDQDRIDSSIFSVAWQLLVITVLLWKMTVAMPKIVEVCESSTLRFASYL